MFYCIALAYFNLIGLFAHFYLILESFKTAVEFQYRSFELMLFLPSS